MSAIGFKYLAGSKARNPVGGGVSQALASDCHDSAVSICYDGYNQRAHEEVSMTMRSAMTGTEGNDADPKIAYGFSHSNSNTSMQTKPQKELGMTLRSVPTGEGATIQDNGDAVSFTRGAFRKHDQCDISDATPTLTAKAAAGDTDVNVVQMRYIVRRLTPTEAERLMGLPDGYTIPMRLALTDALVADFQRIFDTFGAIMYEYALASYERSHREGEPPPKPPKPKSAAQVRTWLEKISNPATCPDSPRYKACGNGWATNQPRWILTRLLAIGEGIDPFGEGEA